MNKFLCVTGALTLAGCFLTPWAISRGVDNAEKAAASTAKPADEKPPWEDAPHICSCDPDQDPNDPPTKYIIPCDSDGKYNQDGAYWCCGGCHKVCTERNQSKPPAPFPPVPPEHEHCAGKKSCPIGDGACCANPKCGQPCPPWSSESGGGQ